MMMMMKMNLNDWNAVSVKGEISLLLTHSLTAASVRQMKQEADSRGGMMQNEMSDW